MATKPEDGRVGTYSDTDAVGVGYTPTAVPHDETLDAPAGPDHSLIDDVKAMIDDGRTYVEAELHFQKSRAKFLSGRVGRAAVLGGIAALSAVLALVALTVGLVIGLTPILTIWGATAVVILLWLIVLGICAIKLRTLSKQLSAAFSEEEA